MLLAAGRQLARRGAGPGAGAGSCCAAVAALRSAAAASRLAPPQQQRRPLAASAAALPVTAATAQTDVEMVEEIVEPREAVYDTFYDPNNRNFVIVTGNVGREPRFTTVTPRQQRPGQPPPEPVSLMTFSVGLAVPGRRPSGGGQSSSPSSSSSSSSSATDWLPVKAWGEVADAARGRVHRGTLLVVSGTLRTEPEPPSQQQQQQGGGGGEDGYQQQQRARAYIHAKSIGIVTRRPSSAADALAMGGAGGDIAAAAPSPDYPAAAAPPPQQHQHQHQQQQQQQYAAPPTPAALAPATPSPTAAAAAVGAPPADRAAACEALWRDWAQTGGDGWFDNRQRKRSGQGNARQPDFRRKAGAPAAFAGTPFEKLDALWIDSPTTPAWVMERL